MAEDGIGKIIEECNSSDESVSDTEVNNRTLQFLRRSDVLAALLNGYQANSFPPQIKRKVFALKNLQLKEMKIEELFYKEIHALECRYNAMYQPLNVQRAKIVNGQYDPTDEECKWEYDNDQLPVEFEEKAKITELDMEGKVVPAPDSTGDNIVGIPNFWLTIFKNVNMLSEMVQEHDEPILEYLIDVKSLLTPDPMAFILEFYFSPNPYFTNEVLTKYYELKCALDEAEPLNFEGPEIVKCRGCPIDWKAGKNVTVSIVKKKQKHKTKTTAVRTVVKTVPRDSFFNFFNPPEIKEGMDGSEQSDEIQALLASDYEIGHFIRERIVPKAVLYFTGEAISDDEYDEEGEEEEDEMDLEELDDEESEEDEDDSDKRRQHKKKHSDKVPEKAKGDNSSECKNQ